MRSMSSSRASSLRGSPSLGAAPWAFIVTLLLFLLMTFMWWTAADERDKKETDRLKYETDWRKQQAEGIALAKAAQNAQQVVGWGTKTFPFGGQTYTLSDPDAIAKHLSPEGMADAFDKDGAPIQVPGLRNQLLNKTSVKFPVAVRSGENPAVTSKPVTFAWMTQDFKAKLTEVRSLHASVPVKPAPPADSDDAAAAAKYRADLEAYTSAMTGYTTAMGQLTAMKDQWKQFNETIGLTATMDPDTTEVKEFSYAPKFQGPVSTLQQLLPLPMETFEAVLNDFRINKEADRATITKLNGDVTSVNTSLNEEKTRYETALAEKDAADKKAQADLTAANQKVAVNESAARKAEQERDRAISEGAKSASTLTAELDAYKARVAADKDHSDLEIRRDDADGTLLAVDNRMALGTINLGSSDKVSPGLKFGVSFVDRGGARQTVGEVQVIKVTGAHSSQVRVLSSQTALVSGLIISNPLYSAKKAINIYPVGWTPDVIQARRLQELGVIVDARPSADTDYFIVPDDWQGGLAPAAPEGAEGEAAPAAGSGPLDKARLEAQTFGATVITRRVLENFLKL